jgi:hypothetical protein
MGRALIASMTRTIEIGSDNNLFVDPRCSYCSTTASMTQFRFPSLNWEMVYVLCHMNNPPWIFGIVVNLLSLIASNNPVVLFRIDGPPRWPSKHGG